MYLILGDLTSLVVDAHPGELEDIVRLPGVVRENVNHIGVDFRKSDFPLEELGTHQSEAQEIYDKAGWN